MLNTSRLTIFLLSGIEVVKEGIRKLRFSQQLRKSETGAKTKKVELTISIDGVAIQEPRSHTILHQFPLHRISYCADDKERRNSSLSLQSNQIKVRLAYKLFFCMGISINCIFPKIVYTVDKTYIFDYLL